eukprot:CAMPEP_0170518180 /NCGR_PEP_ID=MMETSP0209-20121228/3929_1 /TAXON_ID=665100 ORGANISM="Litonotus pictus, Strain P1" /NCGR_SAMPLE_ID=MMETSP0209 /ASSEMBLY_ACC=CAM_ASM_000301 /LENGTH=175 /DNA_ID=CAMNT_0010803635 /DNA_START=124 /DNA_END=651 /DNA_ORIENTATION=-
MAMIKYSILGLNEENKDNQTILNNIFIKVTEEESKEVFIDRTLITKDGKLSMTAKNDGQYRICVEAGDISTSFQLKMNLVILSDNMDEPNLDSAVQADEVFKMHDLVEQVIGKGEKYIEKQHKMIKIEDNDSKGIMQLQKVFYYMTLMQIVIVLAMGVYQIFNLKSFLDKNILDF